jgi:hypothetical protein
MDHNVRRQRYHSLAGSLNAPCAPGIKHLPYPLHGVQEPTADNDSPSSAFTVNVVDDVVKVSDRGRGPDHT